MNMIGLMILQVIMIVIIGITFRYESTHKMASESIYKLWYMLIFTYLMPHIGIFMFFFMHYLWTIKLPVDIVIEWCIYMFVQIFCVLITKFISLLFLIVVCVSCLLLSRRLTVIVLILDNLSIPLSVCHYCLSPMCV